MNDPTTIAELRRCHEVYEAALVGNDVATLKSLFWDSPHSVRYGVAENLYGSEEIQQFRRNRPSIDLARQILRLEITSLDALTGFVNLEFLRNMKGEVRHGRQTQFWRKFPEGWKIVSAHISFLPITATYVKTTANEIDLPLAATDAAAVQQDWQRLSAVAKFLMQFTLDQAVEAAPVFEP